MWTSSRTELIAGAMAIATGWETCRPLGMRPVTIRYRTAGGRMGARSFTTWMTHRGPIVRSEGKRWLAFAMMNKPV